MEAVKVRLETLSGVRAYFEEPELATGAAAAAVIAYAGTAYDAVQDGQASDVNLTVTMLVPKTADRTAKLRLYAFADPTRGAAGSVRTAINGTLGSEVDFATVTNSGGVSAYPLDGGEMLGIEFTVSVAV